MELKRKDTNSPGLEPIKLTKFHHLPSTSRTKSTHFLCVKFVLFRPGISGTRFTNVHKVNFTIQGNKTRKIDGFSSAIFASRRTIDPHLHDTLRVR